MPENTEELQALRVELQNISAREERLDREEREFESETAALVKRIEQFEARTQSIREQEEQIGAQRRQFEEELRKGSQFSSPALGEVVQTKKQALMEFEEQINEREKSLRREEAELYRRRHTVVKKPAGLSRPKKRLKLGMEWLDELLMGGIPQRTKLLLNGGPLLARDMEVLAYRFVLEGLTNGTPGMFVLFDRSAAAVKDELTELTPKISDLIDNGLLKFVEHSTVESDRGAKNEDVFPSTLISAIGDAMQAYKPQTEIRIVVDPMSYIDSHSVDTKFLQFLRDLRFALYHYHYAALFIFTALNATTSEIQSLRHFMDAEIEFKKDTDQTALMVKGLETTQLLQWVDYKQASGTIELGH